MAPAADTTEGDGPIRLRLADLAGEEVLIVDAPKKTAGGWRSRYRLTELRARGELVGRLGWRGGGSHSPVPAESAEGSWEIRHSRGSRLARVWSISDAADAAAAPVATLEKPQLGAIAVGAPGAPSLEMRSVRPEHSGFSLRRRWELAAEGQPPIAHIDQPAKGTKGVRCVLRVEPQGAAEPNLAPILLLACTAALVLAAEDIAFLPST
ncbi:MAG: hypothetical protein ACM3NV_03865 [Syntrophothermus sp.]